MRKFLLLILLILISSISSFTQVLTTNTWYFGHHAGMKFINGSPVALSDGQIYNSEGSSVMCDNDGNLLFYTDGINVWNRNHAIMPNGSGLLGNISSTQMVIVQKPGNCLQYYIFYHSGQSDLKAYYCIVDLTLNGGLGDVVASSKNILISTSVNEKITTVAHQNGKDIWLILHQHNNNTFMSYLITNTGINLPVYTSVGLAHVNMIGYMKASHKGDKIATAITFTPDTRVELYDFNNSTGVLSNPVNFTNWNGAYGLEFSPNDSLLYATQYWNINHLYQIVLATNTVNTIYTVSNGNYDLAALQLGPDGKIYMARYNKNYLSVINNPNVAGTGCNFTENGFTLYTGTTGVLGLPTFHQTSLLSHNNQFTSSNTDCNTFEFEALIPGAHDSILWNFNDPVSGLNNQSTIQNPSHSFSDTGLYNVNLIIYNECYTDTLTELISVSDILQVNIGNDTSVCPGSQIYLQAPLSTSYLWSTGETTQGITVSPVNDTIYSVVISNGVCFASDSIYIETSPLNLDAGPDRIICRGNNTTLNGTGNGSFLWSTGETTTSILVSPPFTSMYYLTVTNGNCTGIDSTLVSVYASQVPYLGPDTILCADASITLSPPNVFNSYTWSTGSNQPSITIDSTGIGLGTLTVFIDAISSHECHSSDTVNVTFEVCSGLGEFIDSEIEFFPNPVIETINIKSDKIISEFEIYDSKGSLCLNYTVVPQSTNYYSVDVRNLQTGSYLIKCKSRDNVVNWQFIKIAK